MRGLFGILIIMLIILGVYGETMYRMHNRGMIVALAVTINRSDVSTYLGISVLRL